MSDERRYRACGACDGTGRCSDPTCWCLSDVCAACRGSGRVADRRVPVAVDLEGEKP